MIILETNRLRMLEFQIEDAEQFYLLNKDPQVIRYTGDKAFINITEAKSFLDRYSEYQKNGYGRWAVESKEDDRFIGWCGLKLNEENLVDLGFRFFQKEWGRGYATESARASIEYGFQKLGLDCIFGRVIEENTASIRVLEKIGMKYWKRGTCEGMDNAKYYRIFR